MNHSYKAANHVTADMAKEWWHYPTTKKVKAKLKDNPLAMEFEVAQFSTFGVHDKDGKFYDFYELEFINPNSKR